VRAASVIGTVLLLAVPAVAQTPVHARIERLSRVYDVHPDLSYSETVTADTVVLTPRGIHAHDRASHSFAPDAQTLEVLEAWVDEPDGTRIPVAAADRFTRPSAAAQSAPGFSGSLTTTVLFPQLRPGSRTHIVWRLVQRTPPLLGFNVDAIPPLDTPVGEASVSITAPAALALHWAARGGFAVAETTEGGVHRVTARITDTMAEPAEQDMPDASDFAPLFLLTSLPDLAEIGAIYWRGAQGRAAVTPAIADLAGRIAGGRSGLDAVRAVYDWVAGNIRYVAVYLDPDDGWVPHAAAEVLARGYGDCKDHVVLMQALLAARGIRAEAALVDLGNRTADLPLWVPQFNHAMVWLPDFGRFANPTDPFARFDSTDRLLAGKTVVLATETGAVLHTPPERPEDNAYRYDARLVIAADGRIDGSATIRPSANLESAARAAMAGAADATELADGLLGSTPEGGFGEIWAGNPRDLSQPFVLRATWHSPHGVTFDGQEALLPVPTGLDFDPPAHLRALLSDRPRQHPLVAAPRDEQWTSTIAVPPGFAVTRLPENVALRNDAGFYAATYERTGRDVRVVRRLVLARPVYPPEQYAALEALIYAALTDARAVFGLARAEAAARGMAAP
jgi:transglutaminase-like putative cysteine protease